MLRLLLFSVLCLGSWTSFANCHHDEISLEQTEEPEENTEASLLSNLSDLSFTTKVLGVGLPSIFIYTYYRTRDPVLSAVTTVTAGALIVYCPCTSSFGKPCPKAVVATLSFLGLGFLANQIRVHHQQTNDVLY